MASKCAATFISRSQVTSLARSLLSWKQRGSVTGFGQGLINAQIPLPVLGEYYYVRKRDGSRVPARVVAAEGSCAKLSPLGKLEGIYQGASAEGREGDFRVAIPVKPQGLVLSCLGEPLWNYDSGNYDSGNYDSGAAVGVRDGFVSLPAFRAAPDPFDRVALNRVLPTGVRSLDGLCTLAEGQRVGLFAEAGVGKTTLMGMIARWASVDAVVVALVGERGREVLDFIENCVGPSGMRKTVIVVATSDEVPSRRMLAPYTAMSVAEYLRDQGARVLFLCDSLTRMARAHRELALSLGELPVHRGYPVSILGELPCLLERAGATKRGSITAIYTLLLDSTAGHMDPIAEEVKSLLDGHVVLSHRIAEAGVRPAIDIGKSLSRLFERVATEEQRKAAQLIRKLLFRLEQDKELAALADTMDAEYREAARKEQSLLNFLQQEQDQQSDYAETLAGMLRLL